MLRNYVMFTQCDNSKHTIPIEMSITVDSGREKSARVCDWTDSCPDSVGYINYYNIFIEPSTNRVLSWFSEHTLTDTKIVYFLNNRSVFAVVVKYDTN